MKQTDPQFKFRLPPELKERLDEAAALNNRALGAEIVHRLEQSFAPRDATAPGALIEASASMSGGGATGDFIRHLVDYMQRAHAADEDLIPVQRRRKEIKEALTTLRMEMNAVLAELASNEDCDAPTRQKLRSKHGALNRKIRDLESELIKVEEQLEWRPDLVIDQGRALVEVKRAEVLTAERPVAAVNRIIQREPKPAQLVHEIPEPKAVEPKAQKPQRQLNLGGRKPT